MIFLNGRLPHGNQPLVSLRIRGPYIEHIGDVQPQPGEETLDLQGAYLLPGLWDTHQHLLLWARSLARLDLSVCASAGQLLELVRAAPGTGWVDGYGWNESSWDSPNLPDLRQLDEAAGDRPCWLRRSDLHSGLANSLALSAVGYTCETRIEGGALGRDPQGNLDGRVMDRAMLALEAAIPELSAAQQGHLLVRACQMLHSKGIVGVVDQRIKDVDDGPIAWQLYQRLRLPLRIHCNRAVHEDLLQGPRFGQGDDWLRCGHVKLFADGSLGSRTARMLEPYLGSQERGLWLTPPEQLAEEIGSARGLGFPVSVHAIGDEAVSVVLSLLQDPRLPKLAVPDRIEHLQLLSEEVLESLNVPNWVASMQPLHLLDDREVSERLLGERSRSYYRLASLARKGVILNFGSDAPVADVSPWLGMQAATRRRRRDEVAWYEEECLSPELALGAYTHEATRALGWTQTGRLEAGCWADFCVVDRSPLTCERPSQVRVLRTVVGGQTHYVV